MITKVCDLKSSQSYFHQLGIVLLKRIETILKFLALLLLGFYRSLLTAFFGGACRFEPSCSEYARDAFYYHRIDKAFILTFKRLIKCRPGGPYGYDPVPPCQEGNQCQHQHEI